MPPMRSRSPTTTPQSGEPPETGGGNRSRLGTPSTTTTFGEVRDEAGDDPALRTRKPGPMDRPEYTER